MIFSLLAAEASALLAGVLGARWVNGLYAANPGIMSFPDQVPRQQQRHARLLCGLLSLLFCYTVLTMPAADAVHLAFLLFFEFFLLRTDPEYQKFGMIPLVQQSFLYLYHAVKALIRKDFAHSAPSKAALFYGAVRD